MVILFRSTLLMIAMLIAGSSMYVQGMQFPHTISQGIQVVIGPIDQFSRTFGLQDDKIADAVRRAIEGEGWKLNESSGLVITVTVAALSQRDEDKFPFKIEVHGGTSPQAANGHEDELWVIGDIPAVRSVDVAWNDDSTILSTTTRLAKTVAYKLRKEVVRIQFNQKKK